MKAGENEMKPMIVVADSARARVFTTGETNSELHEIEVLVHPEGRMHDREISSDLPGKEGGVPGGGAHAYESQTDPKDYELKSFSRRVANYVEDVRKANGLSRLLLIAAPKFLGALRSQLSSETREKIIFEQDKNLTQHSVDELQGYLPKPYKH